MTKRNLKPENDSPMLNRVTFRLSDEEFKQLDDLVKKTGKSKTDIVKEALNARFGYPGGLSRD